MPESENKILKVFFLNKILSIKFILKDYPQVKKIIDNDHLKQVGTSLNAEEFDVNVFSRIEADIWDWFESDLCPKINNSIIYSKVFI